MIIKNKQSYKKDLSKDHEINNKNKINIKIYFRPNDVLENAPLPMML
jgi:hypothetical protein